MQKTLEGFAGAMLLLTVVAFCGGWVAKQYVENTKAFGESACQSTTNTPDCSGPLAVSTK